MKKLFRSLVNLVFKAFGALPNFLTAFSTGNPASPALLQQGLWVPDTSWSNPQGGAEGDWLLYKSLFAGHRSPDLHQASLEGVAELGTVTWNLFERFNIQGSLGTGQYNWKWQQNGAVYHGHFNGGLSWRADGKLILFEIQDTTFALDGQIGGWSQMKGSASENGITFKELTSSRLAYWQTGAALTQKISFFAPYLGIAVNHTSLHIFHLADEDITLHGRHQFGLFGGLTLVGDAKAWLNFEWRQGFEQGITLSGQARF